MSKSELIWVTKELALLDGVGSDVGASFQPSDEHLDLINQYTLDSMDKEGVLAFPVRAMNDSVDRDYDQFTLECIQNLATNKKETGPLGKPFLLSHSRMDMAKGRIYLADTEKKGKVTHLKLWVYVPNTPQYQPFIENLVYGVYWAVSVGVGTAKTACSVCGAEWPSNWDTSCPSGHEKGTKVEKQIVRRLIGLVPEFYELSSVFLGAQYGAEVVKKMADKELDEKPVDVIRKALREVNARDEEEEDKEVEEEESEIKSVVAYKKFPLAEEGLSWSFSSGDGNKILGDPPNWTKYASVHTTVDSDNKETKSSYHLPHHKDIDGIKTVWRGVSAAGNALMGARGGVNISASDASGAKGHLAKHYKEFDKTPPWQNPKVVTLVEEGAELESMDDGSLKITKGTKVWLYDGEKIIRSEVRKLAKEFDEMKKELDIKIEELEAVDAAHEVTKVALDEAKELNKQLTKELEGVKGELESKSKIVDSYLEGLKEEVIKWYKLSKSENPEDEIDTSFAVRLLDKCADDPELMIELREDFETRAKSIVPPEVRRSSAEDSTGIEEKEAKIEEEPDDEGLAESIHG